MSVDWYYTGMLSIYTYILQRWTNTSTAYSAWFNHSWLRIRKGEIIKIKRKKISLYSCNCQKSGVNGCGLESDTKQTIAIDNSLTLIKFLWEREKENH